MPQIPFITPILDGYDKGCVYFQRAIVAFRGGRMGNAESALRSATREGLGTLELILKTYLRYYCWHKMTDSEKQLLDGRPDFRDLRSLMKYAVPPLDQQTGNQLYTYRQIRNRAEHEGHLPSPQELCQALNGIGQLILAYLPLSDEQSNLIHNAITKLSSEIIADSHIDPVTLRELFGASVRVVRLADISPATDEEVRLYYEGVRLTWSIISARGDVERDVLNELIGEFTKPSHRTRMLCLTGEAGAGKSTLAWRIALEVAKATDSPLIQMRDNESSEPWYSLESGVQQYGAGIV